jgi:hypothetical protein
MNYKLIAVSDSDPSWNDEMEAWWNNGGALMWNLYGGMGLDTLILTDEEVQSFLVKAQQINGWDASGGHAVQPVNPVTVLPHSEEEAPESDQLSEAVAVPPGLCCPDCGRPVHPALHSTWNRQEISVPRKQLNHLLSSLQEAIEFSKGQGPNNHRTWENVLDECRGAIESQEPSHCASPGDCD